MNVIAIIPIKSIEKEFGTDEMLYINEKPLIYYAIKDAKDAKLIDRVIISTDDEKIKKIAESLGAEVPFLRPKELTADYVPLIEVFKHCISWLETNENYKVDLLVFLEIYHIFRENGLLDNLIKLLIEEDYDTVFAAYREHHNFWIYIDGQMEELIKDIQKQTRKTIMPVYKELAGIGYVNKASFIKKGRRYGDRIGIVSVTNFRSLIDLADYRGEKKMLSLIAKLLNNNQNNGLI